MIWKQAPYLASLNEMNQGNMAGFLGIEFTEVGDDFLVARMPVNEKTRMPLGRLHGGASVVLAETVGSVASTLCVVSEDSNQYCVGLAINANHVRAALSGYVHAKATPFHLGRSTHVWSIEIIDDRGKRICSSRLTMAVVSS